MKALIKILVTMAVLVGLVSAAALAAPKVLVNTDFAQSKYKINFKPTDTKNISGKLPNGWNDNSEWNAEITLAYTVETEDGVIFLRMDKTTGRAQLAFNISRKLTAGTYKLTMQVKSPSSLSPEVGIRLSGEPYNFLWTTKPSLADEWQTIEEEFDLDPAGALVGVYICLDADGQLDIKSVKFESL